MNAIDYTKELTKDEISLLLYFETCAVDKQGRVVSARMNNEDRDIAKRWVELGFVQFGRVRSDHLNESAGNNFCHLSDEAWEAAHQLRKARASRQWENRNYRHTQEPA